jgi:hypothetical protein
MEPKDGGIRRAALGRGVHRLSPHKSPRQHIQQMAGAAENQ